MNPGSQKKILIVAESIDVEDSSGSKANVALIQNLHKAGYEVVVYHYSRKNIQLENIKCVAIIEQRNNFLFLLSRIQRKIQHNFNINLAKYLEPVFGFSFTFFNDSKSITKSLGAVSFEPDMVITLSKGASFRPHHALLQLPEFHNQWLAYIHDPYPFYYYPHPYNWSEPGYQNKIDFFKDVAAKCRWAGYPSLLLAEWMEDHFQQLKGKRVIMPHQLTKESEPQIQLPSRFDPEKFNLLHAGNLMKQRNPFPLINGFQKFLENNSVAGNDARLLLVGSATHHFQRLKELEEEIPQLYVSDGYVPFEVVLKIQRKTSVNIILESVAELSPFLPGKFPHCIAANKPILHLGPVKSEVRRLLGPEYEYCADADDVDGIALSIEKLYLHWKENKSSEILNRKELENYLSAEFLNKQVSNIL